MIQKMNAKRKNIQTPENKKKKTFYTETLQSKLYYPEKATLEETNQKLIKVNILMNRV